MKLGFFLSALCHLALVLAGMVVLPAKWNNEEHFQVIPIELLTVDEITNVAAKSEEVKEEPQEAPKEEKIFAEAAPEPEVQQKQVAPDALPALPKEKPDEKKPEPKVEEKPKPKTDKLASVRPRHKPKPPAPESTSDFDPDKISALLDKTPDEKKPEPSDFDSAMEDFFGSQVDDNQQKVGPGNDLTMSETDYVINKIKGCWRVPAGAANPEELKVSIRLYLARDGSLAAPPEVVRSGFSSFSKNSFAKAAEDAALRAVQKCAPYDLLPAEKYESWDDWTINFDPSDMVGK